MGKNKFGGNKGGNKNNLVKNGGVVKPKEKAPIHQQKNFKGQNNNNKSDKNKISQPPKKQTPPTAKNENNAKGKGQSPFKQNNKTTNFTPKKETKSPQKITKETPVVTKQVNKTSPKPETPKPNVKNNIDKSGDKNKISNDFIKVKDSPATKNTTNNKITPAKNDVDKKQKTDIKPKATKVYTIDELKSDKEKLKKVMSERMVEVSQKSLYIRPISRKVTPEAIMALSPSIVAFRVMGGPKRKVQNYGFLEFASKAEKESAKGEIQGKTLGNVKITVSDVVHKLNDEKAIDCCTLMVCGLSNEVTKRAVELMFIRAESVDLSMFSTKYNLGCALVHFKDEGAALQAFVEQHGKQLGGKAISLTFSTGHKVPAAPAVPIIKPVEESGSGRKRQLSEANSEEERGKKAKLAVTAVKEKKLLEEKKISMSNSDEGHSSEDGEEEDDDEFDSAEVDNSDDDDGEEGAEFDSSDEELMKALGDADSGSDEDDDEEGDEDESDSD